MDIVIFVAELPVEPSSSFTWINARELRRCNVRKLCVSWAPELSFSSLNRSIWKGVGFEFKVNGQKSNCHLLESQQMVPNQSKRSKWQPRHKLVWSMIPHNGNNGTDPLESIEVVWMGSWSNWSHPLHSWLDQHCPRCSSERGYAHRPPEIDLEWAFTARSLIVVSDIRGIRLPKRRHPSCSWRLWWSFGSVSRETRCATRGRNWKERRHVEWKV